MFARKRIIVIGAVLVCLFLTGGLALAAPKTPKEAKQVVKGLLKVDRRPLGTTVGDQIREVDTFTDPKGKAVYYVIYLDPSGFIIVPADDLVEPIIVISSEGRYDPSADNPLGSLVSEDVPARIAAAQAVEASAFGQPLRGHLKKHKGAIEQASAKAKDKWLKLREFGANAKSNKGGHGVVGNGGGYFGDGLTIISDVWVAPLVQSKWSQTNLFCDGNPLACYNYYTPPFDEQHPDGSIYNYPCGCVATAMAQLMRYHEHPADGIGVRAYGIQIDRCGNSQVVYTRGGDGEGGPYNWDLMELDPASNCGTLTEAQRQAIGALCYDAGISVETMYTAGGSGAWCYKPDLRLTDCFGYSNSIFGIVQLHGGLYGAINPNLDSGHPVLFTSTGNPSHEVVADGYGYHLSTIYHHINMGWGGLSDLWYHLPNDGTGPGVNSCVYNIFTSGSGEIISGRVTSECGPMNGVTITADRDGGGQYATVTNDKGIYFLAKVPSESTYTINATKAGYIFAEQVVTTAKSTDWWPTTITGNLWGVDFVREGTAIVITPCDDFNSIRIGEQNLFRPECMTYTLINEGQRAYHWTATNEENWLDIEPDHGVVAANKSVDVNVCVNLDVYDLPEGSHHGSIIFTNTDNGNIHERGVNLTYDLNVIYNLTIEPNDDFETVRLGESGSFRKDCMIYTLTNYGNTLIDWVASSTEDWLDIEPNGGSLDIDESIDVSVCVNSSAYNLAKGSYFDMVTFANSTSGGSDEREVCLHYVDDHLTEVFDFSDLDLEHKTFTFYPDGSSDFYGVCRGEATGFPTDPNGGENIWFSEPFEYSWYEIPLADGVEVSLYGVDYSCIYLSGNGSIVFVSGVDPCNIQVEGHFEVPRISALYSWLAPWDGGEISYKQLSDKVVLTFADVPEWGWPDNLNSFQAEIFFDGRIRITYLDVALFWQSAVWPAIAGLSEGSGVPANFFESDLTAYETRLPRIRNINKQTWHPYIQDAIDKADDFDFIEVSEGTYYESIDFGGKSVELSSTEPGNWDVVSATIIDANGATQAVDAEANGVVSGFTVTGGTYGVYCDMANLTIHGCIIKGNTSAGVYGSGGSAKIENNKIYENGSYGINCYASSAEIKSNWFYRNEEGLRFEGITGTPTVVRNNTIVYNSKRGIWSQGGATSPIISNCIIWGNDNDLAGCVATYSCISECNDVGDANVTHNLCDTPCFVDIDGNDFHIGPNSPCIDAGDPNGDYSGELDIDGQERVIGPSVDIGADEMVAVITDVNELQAMKDDLDMYYCLGNDIDASATSGWNSGAGFDPVGSEATPFTGIFDGQGHTITDLYINRPSQGHVGLFGLTMYAAIRDVNVADANVTGLGGTGILVGSGRYSKVDRCCSSGTLRGTASDQGPIGGLMGSSIWADTVVSRCHSSADVSAIGAYPTTNRSGGLVGLNSKGSIIIDCYATGKVSGKRKIGGLVGDNTWGSYGGYIKRCYSVGEVTATGGTGGGLVGYNYQGGVTYDSYWDVNTSGWSTSYGGTGKTTTEMMDVNTFEDWDFVNVWDINDGNSYPYLRE